MGFEHLGKTIAVFGLSVGILWHFAKKYASHNPDVADAAKKAAAGKVISLIGRWLR